LASHCWVVRANANIGMSALFLCSKAKILFASRLISSHSYSSITSQARQVRDGLMIAMLALYPIRLKNFFSLEIARNFLEIKGSWWIVLSASETKEGRADERRVDNLLKPALDRYLGKYRPALARAYDPPPAALWLSSNNGAPMSYDAVARVITETTLFTVGVSVSPHLFRTAIASSAAIHGGANPYLASALLHHKGSRITEARYNRASSLSAAQSLRIIMQGYIKN
jgi:integrase